MKIMVGGAPETAEFGQQIGADGSAPNAGDAAKLAGKLARAASLASDAGGHSR